MVSEEYLVKVISEQLAIIAVICPLTLFNKLRGHFILIDVRAVHLQVVDQVTDDDACGPTFYLAHRTLYSYCVLVVLMAVILIYLSSARLKLSLEFDYLEYVSL